MSRRLNDDQVQQFREDGYCSVAEFLTAAEVEEICTEITTIVDRYPDDGGMVQLEPAVAAGEISPERTELGVRKLMSMATRNPLFRRIGFHPSVVGIARQLLGPDFSLLQSMALMNPPRFGTPKVWHQDNAYFGLEPADVFGFWVACDDADIDNGCMHLVPGSHQAGTRPHAGSSDLLGLLDQPDPGQVVPVPLRAGDALVFSAEIFHHTPDNTTNRRRRALQYHYAARHCRRRGEEEAARSLGEIVVAGDGAEQP